MVLNDLSKANITAADSSLPAIYQLSYDYLIEIFSYSDQHNFQIIQNLKLLFSI